MCMRRLEIIGMGLRCIDIVMSCTEMPTWGKSSFVDAFTIQGGGPAGTAMVAASRLGAVTGYVGTIGNDHISELKRKSMTMYDVDISRIVERPFPENQVIFVYVNKETGERVFALLANYLENPVTPAELDWGYLTSADFLLLDGVYPEASIQAAHWMHEAGKTVVIDMWKTNEPVPDWKRELVTLTDIVICGEGFAAAYSGEHDIYKAGRAMLATGPRIVVETVGERGCYTITETEAFHTPAFDVSVVNTTGAGDVFHGAYITGLLKGWDLRTVALFASAVSAVTCTRLGGYDRFPVYTDVVSFLNKHNIELPK
jgi:sulfofructose kinase